MRRKGVFPMAILKTFLLTIAPGLCAITLAGCSLPELLAPEVETPTDEAGANGVTEKTSMLEELARELVDGGDVTELARSYGSTSVSVNPGTDPQSAPPEDTGADFMAGGAPDVDYGEAAANAPAPGSGDSGDFGDDGDSGGSSCKPDKDWSGWDGDVYCGEVRVMESESLEGHGGMERELAGCITIGFDDRGVPGAIPVPLFARGELLDVDVVFENETGVYKVWVYDVTVTVVSATYTPTTADAVLDVAIEFEGEHSSITAQGVHELHTEIVGDSLVYVAQTHYDGHFRAGSAADPDLALDATQDFDCTGTLARQ